MRLYHNQKVGYDINGNSSKRFPPDNDDDDDDDGR